MDFSIKAVDSLGRIVIPSMIRKNLNIKEETLLGINVVDSKIVLSKIDIIESKNNEVLIKLLKDVLDTDILITNLNRVVASTRKELIGMNLSDKFLEVVNKRQKKIMNSLQIVDNNIVDNNFLIYPILKNSILYGSIVIFLKDIEKFNKNEIILDSIMKLYLETYI